MTEPAKEPLAPISGLNRVTPRPRIVITYCNQCHWLLRAGWMAQELLSTFGLELGEVAPVPGGGGVFTIAYDRATIWDRKADGAFPTQQS